MSESDVRDFITDNFSSFHNYIINYKKFIDELSDEKNKILKGSGNVHQILISDLVKLTIIDKLNQATSILDSLNLIDKEFTLLETPTGRGKQPAIDIMAYNKENFCLVLIELKISDSSEREAVTELSAYNQGLQNRFRGLSSIDVLWIPISTEWRVTTKSAIEFEMLWQNTFVMPLKLIQKDSHGVKKIQNIKLECFNPASNISEIECLNLFSYECFEAFDYYTEKEIPNKDAFINYVTGICNRKKINGFVIFHKPVKMIYPYGFTLCIYNPYKGYLHRNMSLDFLKTDSIENYYSALAEHKIINTGIWDIDFKTDEIKVFIPKDPSNVSWDEFWEKDFLSVGEFAENAENPNINFMVDQIKQMIDSNGKNSRAFGTPFFETLFLRLQEEGVDSIMYLGLHLELISKRIFIEHQRGIHTDDFFSTLSSFPYLKGVFREYNFR